MMANVMTTTTTVRIRAMIIIIAITHKGKLSPPAAVGTTSAVRGHNKIYSIYMHGLNFLNDLRWYSNIPWAIGVRDKELGATVQFIR